MSHHIHLARAIAETEILNEWLQAWPAARQSQEDARDAAMEALSALHNKEEQVRQRGHQLLGEQAVAAKLELPEGMAVSEAYANNHEGLADEVAAIKAEMRQP